MTIYSKFGSEARIVRLATAADITALYSRTPTPWEKGRLKRGALLMARFMDGPFDSAALSVEEVCDVADLRADGGIEEIEAAIRAASRARESGPGDPAAAAF